MFYIKNRYEIRDDITIIFIYRPDGEILEVIIDTTDLPKVMGFNNSWLGIRVEGSKWNVRGTYRENKIKKKIINGRTTMSRKLDNSKWEEYINKFNSYRGEITLKDFCIENQLSKTQFYYHKKRLEKANSKSTVFHEISLRDETEQIKQALTPTEIKILIGNATIAIPTSEIILISSIIKELSEKC